MEESDCSDIIKTTDEPETSTGSGWEHSDANVATAGQSRRLRSTDYRPLSFATTVRPTFCQLDDHSSPSDDQTNQDNSSDYGSTDSSPTEEDEGVGEEQENKDKFDSADAILLLGPDGTLTGLSGLEQTGVNPDDLLSPVARLEKYACSDKIFNRQMVARNILDTLRKALDEPEDVQSVLKVVDKLSDDKEPSVRSELMEQIPHIAMFCHEFPDERNSDALIQVVPCHLLPTVVKFLTDSNNQVRKTSQAALLVLLEQDLVDKGDLEVQVCPVIVQLSEPSSLDHYRTEAVALMSKLAPLIGREMTERLFVARYADLCADSLFQVRTVCAANFGELCSVVGTETTERLLLCRFFELCQDGVWGVRKACADVFMGVACVCSLGYRKKDLPQLFGNLLCDPSRWVRTAAFQALGPLISTFARRDMNQIFSQSFGSTTPDDQPSQSAMKQSEFKERELINSLMDGFSFVDSDDGSTQMQSGGNSGSSFGQVFYNSSFNHQSAAAAGDAGSAEAVDMDIEVEMGQDGSGDGSGVDSQCASNEVCSEVENRGSVVSQCVSSEISHQGGAGDGEVEFNSFNFWRVPVLELDQLNQAMEQLGLDSKGDFNLVKPESESANSAVPEIRVENESGETAEKPGFYTKSGKEIEVQFYLPHPDRVRCPARQQPSDSDTSSVFTTDDVWGEPIFGQHQPFQVAQSAEWHVLQDQQDIVPSLLLEHYVSMTDPGKIQTVDIEITRHCAYSLPAVALTLGPKFWPLIKETYEALACDMQWKVRRTVACSLHEVAVILGQDITATDLVPIFNGFLRDLDEVRIGILRHLTDFLKLLRYEQKREYLCQLSEFLKMDNERNWRFRLELVDQLSEIVRLFPPEDVSTYLTPIVLNLAMDRVAEVRKETIGAIAMMISSLKKHRDSCYLVTFLKDLTRALATSEKWIRRQMYINTCDYLIMNATLEPEMYTRHLLGHLLLLVSDRVPNVRLALARTLVRQIMSKIDELGLETVHGLQISQTLLELQDDADRDVRDCATLTPN